MRIAVLCIALALPLAAHADDPVLPANPTDAECAAYVNAIDRRDPQFADKLNAALDGACAAAFERALRDEDEKQRNSL